MLATDTIVALSTPVGESALAIIRLSGSLCSEIEQAILTGDLRADALLQSFAYFATEGLWQVIRIFTGFYNIPMIAIVIIGLFTRQVPAVAAKVVIVFHIVAYGTFQFLLLLRLLNSQRAIFLKKLF